MTALKAHEVAKFLAGPDLAAGVFLVYGPDQGLVRESARHLIRHYGGESPDPMTEITLDAADLAGEPSRLAVEARTTSMFGGTRRVRVRGATKALAPTLTELLDDMPDAVIVLEAGNLPPRDGLRALAESHGQARALPCYADSNESLRGLIRSTLQDAGISADPDVVNSVRETLGNDREVTRRELEKLTLFAMESKTLTRADIVALCGDNAALAVDAICDAAGTGRAEKLDTAIARALDSGIDVQRLLIAALMHFSWLRRLRAAVDAGRTPREVLDAERPRPHFSRKASLEQQLRLWSDDALASASTRFYEAIAESRKTPALARAIAQRALLAVAVAGAHR